MKLLGGIVPFIGFRDEPVDEEMRRFFDLGDEITHINTFQVEWLGRGVVLCLRPVELSERGS